MVDDYHGAFEAVDYLIKTGCKRIAHIKGPSNLSTSAHRLKAYIDALNENNIAIQEELIIKVAGFSPEYGLEAAKQLLSLQSTPDAIFAVNDGVAIGAMFAIKDAGYSIPDQISIIGFDDEPYSSYFMPALTSVWQPVYDMGVLSARILLSNMNQDIQEDEKNSDMKFLNPNW